MLTIAHLPKISFVENNEQTTTLDLAQAGPIIRALSEKIRRKFANEESDVVGIIFPATPLLVISWLAVLDAGKKPVMLSYPTRKLSNEYWCKTIYHTCETLGVQCIITNEILAETDLNNFANILALSALPEPAADSCEGVDGRIVQLSSGTTGHKKAVQYSLTDFARHIEIYNEILQLSDSDKIVSWLPLYHDMGFLACFVMPLYLRVPIIMMDPMTWVADNELFFRAIDREGGTVCYLPNFAFEVMTRVPAKYSLQNMRHWISCSEPTYPDTIRRFCSTHKVRPETVSTCYAMAENVFAVSQSNGFRTVVREGREYVSCGDLLARTQVKFVDGEIFVKSPTSITGYVEKQSTIHVADAEGFYPTGDIGFMSEKELVISGRKRDIMIQAGQKFLLNDLDYAVNAALPACRGRAACLARDDAKIGTQSLLVLIENIDVCNDQFIEESRAVLSSKLPVEGFVLEVVPPGFITKTSSGKINRSRTLADYELMRQYRESKLDLAARTFSPAILERDMKELIGRVPVDLPFREFLDSLGYVSLQVLCHDRGIDVNPDMTINLVLSCAREREKARLTIAEGPVLRIVSLMDTEQIAGVTTEDLSEMSEALGMAIYWENICMPPAEIVYNDFLFENYFLCRDDEKKYEAYVGCLDTMRSASVLLFDDYQEIWFPASGQSYPVMSFGMRRQPVADLLCVRKPRYYRNYHHLPVENLVTANDLDFLSMDAYIQRIGRLTGAMVYRVAVCQEYAPFTSSWELRSLRMTKDEAAGPRGITAFIDKAELLGNLTEFLRNNLDRLTLDVGPQINTLLSGDDQHMCSACLNPLYIEAIVRRFDRFLIQGLESSLPYLRKRITDLGKSFHQAATWSIDQYLRDGGEERFDCIIQTGAVGTPKTALPIFSLQSADHYRGLTVNAPEDMGLEEIPIYMTPAMAGEALAAMHQ
jgi:acyl-CoA synthetase (AMP-forming)/AMP-acid ligase II